MVRIRHQHWKPAAPGLEADLFTPPSVHVDTSEAAARRVRSSARSWRAAIYAYLRTCGDRGATAGELEAALGIKGSTLRPRLIELCGDAKWARDLPAVIRRTPAQRDGMRVYVTV